MSNKALLKEYKEFIDSLTFLEQTCKSEDLNIADTSIYELDQKDAHEILQIVKSGNASLKKVVNTYKCLKFSVKEK